MPDFRVIPVSAETRLWTDPASAERPSRITSVNDRQHRYLRFPAGIVRLEAIMADATVPEDDTVVGLFTSWPIEFPGVVPPPKSYPIPGSSSVVEYDLANIGHYLLAMRHEDTQNAPKAVAGGVVLVHIDITGS